ncbi:MAG: putative transposase [Gammaproteobacteria bacterium]
MQLVIVKSSNEDDEMTREKTKEDLLIDELLKDYSDPKQILGETGLLKQLQKKLVEHAFKAELNEHLGYEMHEQAQGTNHHNGLGRKTVQSDAGQFEIEVPRDRDGSFEPRIVKQRQRRLEGFDEQVLSLYGGGLSTREIQSQLEDLYGFEVSPTLISNVTDAVLDEVKAWRSRPLDAVYPIVYVDALMVKSRQDGSVKNRAVYLALGINMEGEKVLLGLWMSENEGAKFSAIAPALLYLLRPAVVVVSVQ